MLFRSPGNFSGSDDEQDFRRALEAQERFRKTTASRGSSRGIREASPSSTSHKMRERTGSDHHISGHSAKSSSSQQLYTLSSGHDDALASVRQLKNERQLKKEAAARELEERRKSLARRPTAPAIPHPDELSPIATRAPTSFFDRAQPNSGYVVAKDLPHRSATADPPSSRSPYTSTRPAIGLPATPKAMRLIMEPEAGAVPGVPKIPTTFAQRASPTSMSPIKVSLKKEIPEPQLQPQEQREPSPKQLQSPRRQSPQQPPPQQQQEQQQQQQQQQEAPLTLLPSTVYSPPVRPPIDRCMSAPPAEVLAPKAFGGSPISRGLSRQHSTRKMSQPDVMADMRQTAAIPTIDAMIGGGGRRPSHDNQVPPPPPPPPMLKELQHLATPPPPPPAPLPYGVGSRPQVYGGTTSGMIEIVMDDDDQAPPPPPPAPSSVPVASPLSESVVPILSPPAPPSAKGVSSPTSGHHRGRSSVDNSLSGRFSRATERMRSGSRNRTTPSSMVPRRSPETATSPYDSFHSGPPVSFSNSRAAAVQHMDQQQIHVQNDYRTGLHKSEMI